MDRIWHDNVFLSIAFGQCLDKFMLQPVLVEEFMGLEADIKFYA